MTRCSTAPPMSCSRTLRSVSASVAPLLNDGVTIVMNGRSTGRQASRVASGRDVRHYHQPALAKKALITGITGQDGSYLAEQLLDRGYEVHGLIRRSSSFNTERIDPLYRDPHEQGTRLFLHHADLSESSRLVRLVYELQPDEVYHLGAQSHVRVSFDEPEYTT